MDNPICPETGAPMERGVQPMTITYKGQSLTFDMPGWYCAASGESVHSGEDMKVSDRALNRLKAQVEGLLMPEEVRRIRKRLGLTQKLAGHLIGGGRNAFQKYESGDVLASLPDASDDWDRVQREPADLLHAALGAALP